MTNARFVLASVVLIAFGAALAQEPDEKAVLEELAKRKVLDVEALKKRLDRLSTLSALELDAELKLLEKEQEAILKDWQKIDSLRRTKRPGVPPMEIRTATYVLKLWQLTRGLEAKLQVVQDREDDAFEKRYKQPLSTSSPKYKEWSTSEESRALDKERNEIKTTFRNKLRELGEEAAHGNVESEKNLVQVQRQILDEYNATARALEQTVIKLDMKNGKKAKQAGTALFDQFKGSKPTRPELYTDRRNEYVPVGVGDSVTVRVGFHGGKPPYDLLWWSTGGSGYDVFHKPSQRELLFVFTTPGQHRIKFTLKDSQYGYEDTHTQVRETWVRVIERKKEEEPKKPDPPKPAETKPEEKKTEAPPPPPPLLTPFPGSYRAQLWCSPMLELGHVSGSLNPPAPVSLTIDSSGNITGRCNYTAPHYLCGTNPVSFRRAFTSYNWTTRFTLQGKVDWQTGKIELKVPDGHVSAFHGKIDVDSFKKKIPYRNEMEYDYVATLIGRHTSDPHLSGIIGKQPILSPPKGVPSSPQERLGMPEVITGPSGQPRFADAGWCGLPGMDAGTVNADVRVRKHLMKVTYVKTTVTDVTANRQKGHEQLVQQTGGGEWFLKLLGPDTTPEDLKKLDIVGTAFWPEKVTAKVGEPVHVEYYGVLSNNYAEPRDLTEVAEWQAPPGLQQVQPGVFRSDTPGQYKVRARAKGKDGNWMEGFLTINVAGS